MSAHQNTVHQSTVRQGSVIRASLGLSVITLGVYGFLYSVLGTGLGQALFPEQANGSLLVENGKVVGSSLVAQPFTSPKYFYPRPSASGYNMMSMGGSNQALTNPDLKKRLKDSVAQIAKDEGVKPSEVPSDLATQSGSGNDPDISPQAALIQVQRVATNRGISEALVKQLVQQHIQPRQFGVLGEPRVNVLELNLALDKLDSLKKPATN